jgi:hypothetical protein
VSWALPIVEPAHAQTALARMIGIATIIFGVALLIQGGTMLSEYARIIFPPGAKAASVDHFGGNSLSAIFLVGAAGIVLGLLALLGINHLLTSVAVIAFGTALVLSSNSVWHLHVLKHAVARAESQSQLVGSEILASEMASGSAAIQALAGLAAIVLGSRRDGCNSPDPGRFARPWCHAGHERKHAERDSDELDAAFDADLKSGHGSGRALKGSWNPKRLPYSYLIAYNLIRIPKLIAA